MIVLVWYMPGKNCYVDMNLWVCCREKLVTNITEQERLGRLLREDQKAVKDLVQTSAKQLGMWRDVVK